MEWEAELIWDPENEYYFSKVALPEVAEKDGDDYNTRVFGPDDPGDLISEAE